MPKTLAKSLTLAQFLQECPEDGQYELVDGQMVKKQATAAHDNVCDWIADTFKGEIRRDGLDLVVKNTIVLETTTAEGQTQGRNPDVSVVEGAAWDAKLQEAPVFQAGIVLVVEVTSNNWKDDYIRKLDEYERFGVKEYWVVDFQAKAASEWLGLPKQPTLFIYTLVNGRYQRQRFHGEDRLVSLTFPQLDLTLNQLIAASGPRSGFGERSRKV